MIFITSYQRPQMLLRLLEELHGKDEIIVIDDGSTYDPAEHVEYCDYYRFSHKGKPGFWVHYKYALEMAEDSDHDHFMFMPDDWYGYDMEKMGWIHSQFNEPYAFNFANRGLDQCWTPIQKRGYDLGGYECWRVGFVDCCFSTNRSALEKIGFTMEPVSVRRFNRPGISSGVGQQLSNRFMMEWIPMFKPKRSLCCEDPHPSLMNPIERQRNPRVMV